MPYKVVKNGMKFQVFKLDADNKPTGKPLGTHPDKPKADAQMRALYANEKKPVKKEDSSLEEELETKDYYEDDEMPMMPGGPTSFADLLATRDAQEMAEVMEGLTDDFGTLAYNISCDPSIGDKAVALASLAQEFQDMVSAYAKHEMNGEETIGEEIEDHKALAIAKQIAGDNQPAKAKEESSSVESKPDLFIWKEANTYHWLVAYSNNRRDSDNPPEIITTESHKEFDTALTNKEWPMPELWLWHIDYPVGITQYHAFDESTGFPVAAGIFNKGMEWAAEGVIQAGWDGASHGMPTEWIKKQENNLIVRHRTKEITLLPTWAAANKLAFNIISKETSMTDEKGLPSHKRTEFVKAFGEERVKQIEAALENKAKEANAANIEQKEATPNPLAEILKGMSFLATELAGVKTELATLKENKVKEDEAPFDLVTFLKEKSAIGKQETKVDGRSTLAKDAPTEEANPAPIGANFSAHLIAANQQYYANRGMS